jgi:hypothetical protein
MRLTIGMIPPAAAFHWRARNIAHKAANVIIRRRSGGVQAGDISAGGEGLLWAADASSGITDALLQKSQELQSDALSLLDIALIGINTSSAGNNAIYNRDYALRLGVRFVSAIHAKLELVLKWERPASSGRFCRSPMSSGLGSFRQIIGRACVLLRSVADAHPRVRSVSSTIPRHARGRSAYTMPCSGSLGRLTPMLIARSFLPR